MSKFLHREDAPFGGKVWEKIDDAVVSAAKAQLSGRRLLHIEGPYGLGFKAVPVGDSEIGAEGEATVAASQSLSLASISGSFSLMARDLAAYEASGSPLDLEPATRAAIMCAKKEDDIVFTGSKVLGIPGLLTAKGTQRSKLQPWTKVGAAAEDLIGAVTSMDEVGYYGPYALALAPSHYNLLLRRYSQGNMTEMDHVKSVVGGGVVKAPAISAGGILIAAGKQFAHIVVGQDLATGFVGPTGTAYEFVVVESVALSLIDPGAVCVLK